MAKTARVNGMAGTPATEALERRLRGEKLRIECEVCNTPRMSVHGGRVPTHYEHHPNFRCTGAKVEEAA